MVGAVLADEENAQPLREFQIVGIGDVVDVAGIADGVGLLQILADQAGTVLMCTGTQALSIALPVLSF